MEKTKHKFDTYSIHYSKGLKRSEYKNVPKMSSSLINETEEAQKAGNKGQIKTHKK